MHHKLWNLYAVAVKVKTHEFLLRDLFHDNVSISGCMYKLSGKTDDWWIGKYLEGRGRGQSVYFPDIYLDGWESPLRKHSRLSVSLQRFERANCRV
jgi:hypothetical protein